MLLRLEIKDFAVISHAVFEPENGFNSISGETGAGKSLLIDAIGLILGNKASKNLIRTESDSAFVEALFDASDVKDSRFKELLDESGIELEDGLLIVSRKITKDGKSIARINGRTVILAVLKAVTSFLVDIHGQHDTQMIFDESSHVSFLDSYAGEEVINLLDDYKGLLKEMKDIVLKIRSLSASPEQIKQHKEFLREAISEIENANLDDDEEDNLYEIIKSIKSKEKSLMFLREADSYLNGEDSTGLSSLERLENASKIMQRFEEDKYMDLNKRLSKLTSDFELVSSEISGLLSDNDFDADYKDECNSRLNLILDLKNKYSCSDIKELKNYKFKAEDELQELDNNSALLIELRRKRSEVEAQLLNKAEVLSDVRKKYALKLSTDIQNELKDLQMPKAIFDVRFVRRSKERFFSDKGIDNITFMFSSNPGEESKSLSQTASGGEASRIMLAIKSILSSEDTIPTLIFDEIDTGVSGVASNSIAHKLKNISKYHQVLCVTHTSQLVAASDVTHFINKSVVDDKTSTSISKLSADEKILEVSRLLSGTDASLSINLAKELIDSFEA